MAQVLSKRCEELGEHDFTDPVQVSVKEKSWWLFFFDSTEQIAAGSICRRCGTQNTFWLTTDD